MVCNYEKFDVMYSIARSKTDDEGLKHDSSLVTRSHCKCTYIGHNWSMKVWKCGLQMATSLTWCRIRQGWTKHGTVGILSSKILDFSEGSAEFLRNSDWTLPYLFEKVCSWDLRALSSAFIVIDGEPWLQLDIEADQSWKPVSRTEHIEQSFAMAFRWVRGLEPGGHIIHHWYRHLTLVTKPKHNTTTSTETALCAYNCQPYSFGKSKRTWPELTVPNAGGNSRHLTGKGVVSKAFVVLSPLQRWPGRFQWTLDHNKDGIGDDSQQALHKFSQGGEVGPKYQGRIQRFLSRLCTLP